MICSCVTAIASHYATYEALHVEETECQQLKDKANIPFICILPLSESTVRYLKNNIIKIGAGCGFFMSGDVKYAHVPGSTTDESSDAARICIRLSLNTDVHIAQEIQLKLIKPKSKKATTDHVQLQTNNEEIQTHSTSNSKRRKTQSDQHSQQLPSQKVKVIDESPKAIQADATSDHVTISPTGGLEDDEDTAKLLLQLHAL